MGGTVGEVGKEVEARGTQRYFDGAGKMRLAFPNAGTNSQMANQRMD